MERQNGLELVKGLDIHSPYLFNLYSQYMVRKSTLDGIETGVRLGGRCINNLRNAVVIV